MRTFSVLLLVLGACVVDVGGAEPDEPELSAADWEVLSQNKLTSNKLTSNKLTSNALGAAQLSSAALNAGAMLGTADRREVLSYIVSCALSSTQTLTATGSDGVVYTFAGAIGLAPAWATRVPTISERRWVTACVLARTNLYGVPVDISMRHDTNPVLAATAEEKLAFTVTEGAFYGDLFQTAPEMYACSTRRWTEPTSTSPRVCSLSPDGITTDCGFTYTGLCNVSTATCTDRTAPFGGCIGAAKTHAEVITVQLRSEPVATQPTTQTTAQRTLR